MECMWKNPIICIRVQNFQVDILQNDQLMVFWRSEMTIFSRCSLGFPHFSNFKILSDLGRSKSVLEPFSHSWRQNWPKDIYHASQIYIFFNLSLTSWHWMTLILNMLAQRSLGSYLKVSQTRSMPLYWLISILYGRSARQNQIVKHFGFDLTCDVIGDPEVNKIRFTSTTFPDLANAVWIL